MADTLTAMVDEITAKRVENDVKRLDEGAAKVAQTAEAAIGNLPALQAEFSKRLPDWATELTTMPSALCTYASSRLRAIGAPSEYIGELLRTLIDETAPRMWPQPGVARPEWVKDQGTCDCGQEHPGGATDQASQVCRLLLLAYSEFVEVVAGKLLIDGEIPMKPSQDEAENDEADRRVRERALEVMDLLFSIFRTLEM